MPRPYFPALSATHLATASASAPLRRSAGMTLGPLAIVVRTVFWSGLSWSRFGPTCPRVLAAFSVWQPPHVVAKVAPGPLEGDAPPPDEPPSPPPHPAAIVSARAQSAAVSVRRPV